MSMIHGAVFAIMHEFLSAFGAVFFLNIVVHDFFPTHCAVNCSAASTGSGAIYGYRLFADYTWHFAHDFSPASLRSLVRDLCTTEVSSNISAANSKASITPACSNRERQAS